MKPCPYCAEEIQDAAIVCHYCGRELTPSQPKLRKVIHLPKISRKMIAILATFLFILLVISSGWLFTYSPIGIFPARTATQRAKLTATQNAIATSTEIAIAAINATIDAQLYGPCGTLKVTSAQNKLSDIVSKWSNLSVLAGSTSRIALSPLIEKMQSLRSDARDVEVPQCLLKAKKNLLSALDEGIAGYLSFMGQLSDEEVMIHLNNSNSYIDIFLSEEKWVLYCMPNCDTILTPLPTITPTPK